jgi:hypothetical protein
MDMDRATPAYPSVPILGEQSYPARIRGFRRDPPGYGDGDPGRIG